MPPSSLFWNRLNFPAPPTVTFRLSNLVVDESKRLKTCLERGLDVLSDDSHLSSEYFILNRLIYKYTNQFAHEKSLQSMQQVKSCLGRYRKVNLQKVIKDFLDTVSWSGGKAYLPSRQMLEYLLSRILGTSYLVQQASVYCERTYIYCLQQLEIGYFIPNNILIASVVARIWVLVRGMGVHMEKLYKSLHPWLSTLQPTPVPWIPDGQTLPNSLDDITRNESSNLTDTEGIYKLGMIDKKNKDVDQILEHMATTFQVNIKKDEETEMIPKDEEAVMTDVQPLDLGVLVRRKTVVSEECLDKNSAVHSPDKTDNCVNDTIIKSYIKNLTKGPNFVQKIQKTVVPGKCLQITQDVTVTVNKSFSKALKTTLKSESSQSPDDQKVLRKSLRKKLFAIFKCYLNTVLQEQASGVSTKVSMVGQKSKPSSTKKLTSIKQQKVSQSKPVKKQSNAKKKQKKKHKK